MPALATATSRPPKRSTVSATAAIIAPWSVTSAPIPIARSPIRSAASRASLGVEVEDRDRGAAHVDLARGLVADPARGAGHQRHLSVQVVDGHAAAAYRPPGAGTRAPRITCSMPGFRPVDTKQSFPELEERVLERWRERDVFQRSLANREGAEVWSFYEGPPTANGRPGSHHVLSRVFKDIYPRYRTMCGYRVPRKAGWDCHGLPVEIEVEKAARHLLQAGDRGVRDRQVQRALPRVGLRVRRGVEPADRADRLLDRPRRPLRHPRRRLHRVGLVVAAPALGRRTASTRATRSSPTARAAARRSPRTRSRSATRTSRTPPYTCASRCSATTASRAGESLLVWTTTPWTLPGNDAVAVAPGRHLRQGAGRRRDPDPRRAAGREGARRGRRDPRPLPGLATWSAAATRARSSTSTIAEPRRLPGPRRRLRHHRGRHRPRPHRPRLRRGRLRGRRRERASSTRPSHGTLYNPVGLDGTLRQPGHRLRGQLRQGPGGHRGADRRPRRAAACSSASRSTSTPTRTAGAAARRCSTTPSRAGTSRTSEARDAAARQQRDDRLAPRAHQARPLRQMAGEQRRLGALPRPLLGDAAADLGVRRRGLRRPLLRRLGRRAARARRAARSPRTCTAPTSTRSSSTARSAAGRCAGSSR